MARHSVALHIELSPNKGPVWQGMTERDEASVPEA
jgi:hypothetical protein